MRRIQVSAGQTEGIFADVLNGGRRWGHRAAVRRVDCARRWKSRRAGGRASRYKDEMVMYNPRA